MRKKLIAALVTVSLGSAAAAAFIATNAAAQAPAPNTPMLLAQATPPAPNAAGRRGPAANGPGARGPSMRGPNRPAPTAAQQAARRDAMCQEGTARTAGRLASLEVRLNLSDAQGAAFNRWRDVRLAAAKRQAAACIARPMPPQRGPRSANATPPSPVERLTRQETMLQSRLADIQAERPALEALYTGLSPAQRQTLARGERGGMMGRGPGGNHMMFRRGGMGGGMGMRGPDTDPGIIQGPGRPQ